MEFELIDVVSTGGIQAVDEVTFAQYLNITVGVKGNPHNMSETQTIKYEFSNSLTVQQAKDGIANFANAWVASNYPAITE